MPYGSGQRLGETIDPRLIQADYSGFTNAAAVTGNSLANIGQQVGGVIKQYKDDEKTIKKSAQMAKSIRDYIPELAGMADNALAELSNPDLSQRDRLAIAEGIQNSLEIGVMGLKNNRSNAMLKLEADKIKASMQGEARNIMTADQLQQQIQSGAKVKYVPLGNGMYEVESATANELPMFGNVTVGPDGKIQQAPSGGGNIRIPGSGAGIQNALPQGQGGMFPDNVAPTGLPIDQAAGFIPGVSVGGTPGVLPPKQQPIIPVGEVPKGDVDGGVGTLPPRQGAAQQIQQAQTLSPQFGIPNSPVPKDDVWRMDKDGLVGATRIVGSTPEVEYQNKALDAQIKMQTLAKASVETKDLQEKQKLKDESKKVFSLYIGEMAGAYLSLYKAGGAVVGGESGIIEFMANTPFGQKVGRATGSKDQVYRDVINGMAPNVINVIRQASEMGAKGLDSEKELAFYLGALGDPTRPIEANLKAIDILDKAYGDGKAVSNMLIENPQLLRKVKEYGLKFDNKEEKAAGSTPLDTNPEVEQMLKELGL